MMSSSKDCTISYYPMLRQDIAMEQSRDLALAMPGSFSQDHSMKMLITTILLENNQFLCSFCEGHGRPLELGECGHLVCGNCLHQASQVEDDKIDEDSANYCRLCFVAAKAKADAADLLPRYMQYDHADIDAVRYASELKTAHAKSAPKIAVPDLTKFIVDDTGILVLKPEFAHEDPNYKADAITGSFHGAEASFDGNSETVKEVRGKTEELFKSYIGEPVVRYQRQSKEKARAMFEAVATPAKKAYHGIKGLPVKGTEAVRAEWERETRAIRGELGQVKFRLEETRWKMHENALQTVETGMSSVMKLFWAAVFIACMILIAWYFDVEKHLDFDSFQEWLDHN